MNDQGADTIGVEVITITAVEAFSVDVGLFASFWEGDTVVVLVEVESGSALLADSLAASVPFGENVSVVVDVTVLNAVVG